MKHKISKKDKEQLERALLLEEISFDTMRHLHTSIEDGLEATWRGQMPDIGRLQYDLLWLSLHGGVNQRIEFVPRILKGILYYRIHYNGNIFSNHDV